MTLASMTSTEGEMTSETNCPEFIYDLIAFDFSGSSEILTHCKVIEGYSSNFLSYDQTLS